MKENVIGHATSYFENIDSCNCITIDGVRAQFEYGWILIRKSNTQPVLSVRCEADTQEQLTLLKKEIALVLKKYIDEKDLKELC